MKAGAAVGRLASDAWPPFGALQAAEVHAGTAALRSATNGIVRRAQTRLDLDVFRITDRSVVKDLLQAQRRGVTLGVLADTENASGRLVRRLRSAAGDGWVELGAPPRKQHGKAIVRDRGVEALVGTDLADKAGRRRFELGASFGGAPARALARIGPTADPQTLGADLTGLARLGVLVNDPRSASTFATQAVERAIEQRGTPLLITTKSFDSDSLADALGRRAQYDPVDLVTHHVGGVRKDLERAGVRVHMVDEAKADRARRTIHGTVLESGGQVLMGSAYLDDHVLYGSSGRQSRELFVALAGTPADQTRAAARLLRSP